MKTKIVTALISILALSSISAAQAFPGRSLAAVPVITANYYNNGFFLNRLPNSWGNPYGNYAYRHRCHRHRHYW